MKALTLTVNGQRIGTAGIGPSGVLSGILTWVGGIPHRSAEGDWSLSLGGLDSRTEEHVRWKVPNVGVGDVVTFELLETEDIDSESARDLRNCGEEPDGDCEQKDQSG